MYAVTRYFFYYTIFFLKKDGHGFLSYTKHYLSAIFLKQFFDWIYCLFLDIPPKLDDL